MGCLWNIYNAMNQTLLRNLLILSLSLLPRVASGTLYTVYTSDDTSSPGSLRYGLENYTQNGYTKIDFSSSITSITIDPDVICPVDSTTKDIIIDGGNGVQILHGTVKIISSQTATNAITIDIKDLTFKNQLGHGLRILFHENHYGPKTIILNDVHARDTLGNGIDIEDNSDWSNLHFTLNQCTASDGTLGVYITKGEEPPELQQPGAFGVWGAITGTLTGCNFSRNDWDGFHLEANNNYATVVNVTDCNFTANGAVHTGDGFEVEQNSWGGLLVDLHNVGAFSNEHEGLDIRDNFEGHLTVNLDNVTSWNTVENDGIAVQKYGNGNLDITSANGISALNSGKTNIHITEVRSPGDITVELNAVTTLGGLRGIKIEEDDAPQPEHLAWFPAILADGDVSFMINGTSVTGAETEGIRIEENYDGGIGGYLYALNCSDNGSNPNDSTNPQDGIEVIPSGDGAINYIYFADCTISNNKKRGVVVREDAGAPEPWTDKMELYFSLCNIKNNTQDGIRLESSNSPPVDNVVSILEQVTGYQGNGGDDLDLRDRDGTKVTNSAPDPPGPDDWDLFGVAPDLN